ncbi:hypothetical protein [Litoribrevibacter albus]|uniref:VWFA domain-containing protein n=1 Tax=Litoribrevibacter albus TaxID=1473156 RepID=A0AA37S979_9GAMM|nr:hypothetical protein [Litoribrevibacter albus]GLQ30514.1 hypothetical protein GCM10007876_09920 [Litoribrevibacter albus]
MTNQFGLRLPAILVLSGSLLTGCNLFDSDKKHSNDDSTESKILSAAFGVAPSDACPAGGNAFAAGVDTNGDSTLGDDEVTENLVICDGQITEENIDRIISTVSIGFGDLRCSTGGYLVNFQQNSTIREEIVCNANDATDDAIDLISSFSANPANPEINSDVTMTIALSRQPEDGETFGYRWENTTLSEIIENNAATLTVTAPEAAGAITYQATIISSLGQEEIAQLTLNVREQSEPASVDSVTTTSKQVFIPSGYEQPEAQPQGDFDGVMLYAGESSGPSISSVRAAALTVRKVSAFVAERPVLNSGSNAQAVLANFANTVAQDTDYALQNISTSQLEAGAIALGSYQLVSGTEQTPTDVANDLVQLLGVNKIGGVITNLPVALDSEIGETNYRLNMTVVFLENDPIAEDDNKVLLLVSLVNETEVESFEGLISGLTDGTNIAEPTDTTTVGASTFTGSSVQSKADFLFVIDNSGSMFDEQQAVANAADDFEARINNSGLDIRIGTINTGSYILLADTNQDGSFTSDLSEFKNDVINQGTDGSSRETGIYNAERALYSIALGDVNDGVVTEAGFPRADASMSVVILSDEPSQYEYRAGEEFDVSNNLFLARNYRVYAIVEPDSQFFTSQYDDLALASGGSVADISNTSSFDAIMDDIATKAGAAASAFQLPHSPISGSIKVTVNGLEVTKSSINGWNYISLSNSVVFYGTSVPEEGDIIEIVYDYLTTNN